MSSISSSARSTSITVFCIACIGHFIVDFCIGLWPVWKTMAGYSIVEAGVIAGVAVFIGEGLQAFFGPFADRGYWRGLIAFGICAGAISLFIPITSTVYMAGLLFFITCIGSSAFHPTAVGIVSSVKGFSKPVLIAIFHTSGLIGLGISQIVFRTMCDIDVWLPSILVVLPIGLFLFLYLHTFRNAKAIVQKEHEVSEIKFSIFFDFLRNRQLRKLYLLSLANQIMVWSFLFLLPDILLEKGTRLPFAFGGGHCAYVMGAASTCVPLGILAKRLNTPLVVVVTYIASIFSLTFFLFQSTNDPMLLGVTLFSLGGASGAIAPLTLAIGHELEPKMKASVSAFLMGFVWIFAEGLGYGLSSFLASLFAKDPATTALMIMGSGLFFGLVAAYTLYQELEGDTQKVEAIL